MLEIPLAAELLELMGSKLGTVVRYHRLRNSVGRAKCGFSFRITVADLVLSSASISQNEE